MRNPVTKCFSKIPSAFDRKIIKTFKQKQHRKVRRNVKQQLHCGNEVIKEIKPLTSWDID